MAKKKAANTVTAPRQSLFEVIVKKLTTDIASRDTPIKLHTYSPSESVSQYLILEWRDAYWIALCMPDPEQPTQLRIAADSAPAVSLGRSLVTEANIGRLTDKQLFGCALSTANDVADQIIALIQSMRALQLVI